MLAYYKMNYPPPPEPGEMPAPGAPNVNLQVLMFHGLEDTALHSDGLNNTWDWVDRDLTIVTVPGAGHFVQQDAADLVTTTMRWWLLARR
jgi:pimeloyl-ACP methyl ester carboxylesterase